MDAASARALKKLESKLKDYRQGRVDPVTRIYWDMHYEVNLKMAIENTKEGDAVLDVGCGTGSMTIDLAKAGRRCCGIDPLYEVSLLPAQTKAREENVDIPLIRAFSEHMPIKAESFDAVLLLSTLQHVADQKETLKELRRIMKKTGVMLVSVPMSKNVFSLFKRGGKPGHFTREYDVNQLIETLNEGHFKIVALSGCGAFPPMSHKALYVCHKFFGSGFVRRIIEMLDVLGGRFSSTASSIIVLCKVSE
jgi:ubiquinone/menaquinone biosynthesis C-methylase UbiE